MLKKGSWCPMLRLKGKKRAQHLLPPRHPRVNGHAFARFHFLGSDNLHFKARLNIEVLSASMCFRRSRTDPRWNRLNTEKPFVPNCLVSSLPSHDNVISDS